MTTHRWLAVGLAVMVAVGVTGANVVDRDRPEQPVLGLELIEMAADLGAPPSLADRAFGRNAKQDVDLAILQRHQVLRLQEIVAEHGWPGRTLVGFDGAHAAFELLQFADASFRAHALALMLAAPAGEVDRRDLAVSTDVFAVSQGEPQVYGTQIGCNPTNGRVELLGGLVDEKRVDERRARVGLPPIRGPRGRILKDFGSCRVD